jgi:hypothetical protein
MLAVPFLPETKRIQPLRPIDREDPVEVIDLVLQQLGTVALDLQLGPLTLEILIAKPDPIRPGDPDQEIRKGEAVVPHLEVFGSYVEDLRVDQWPGLSPHLDIHHPNWSPNLRGRNAPPLAEAGLPISQGFPHVIHDDPDPGRLRPCDGLTRSSKDRVSQESNPMNGHVITGQEGGLKDQYAGENLGLPMLLVVAIGTTKYQHALAHQNLQF